MRVNGNTTAFLRSPCMKKTVRLGKDEKKNFTDERPWAAPLNAPSFTDCCHYTRGRVDFYFSYSWDGAFESMCFIIMAARAVFDMMITQHAIYCTSARVWPPFIWRELVWTKCTVTPDLLLRNEKERISWELYWMLWAPSLVLAHPLHILHTPTIFPFYLLSSFNKIFCHCCRSKTQLPYRRGKAVGEGWISERKK